MKGSGSSTSGSGSMKGSGSGSGTGFFSDPYMDAEKLQGLFMEKLYGAYSAQVNAGKHPQVDKDYCMYYLNEMEKEGAPSEHVKGMASMLDAMTKEAFKDMEKVLKERMAELGDAKKVEAELGDGKKVEEKVDEEAMDSAMERFMEMLLLVKMGKAGRAITLKDISSVFHGMKVMKPKIPKAVMKEFAKQIERFNTAMLKQIDQMLEEEIKQRTGTGSGSGSAANSETRRRPRYDSKPGSAGGSGDPLTTPDKITNNEIEEWVSIHAP